MDRQQVSSSQNVTYRELSQGVGAEETQKYLTFELSGSLYGIGVDDVKEVIEYGTVTRVPMTPQHIRGVMNLRGNVVPVVNLAARLGKDVAPVHKRSCVIIVEASDEDSRMDLGFVVDAVDKVMDIDADQIEPPPSFGADIPVEFINGMGKIDNEFVVLLEIKKLMSLSELSQLVAEMNHRN